jgi:hypothetical protein
MPPLHVFTVWLLNFNGGFLKSVPKEWTIILPCGGVQGQLSNVALNIASDSRMFWKVYCPWWSTHLPLLAH